MRGLVRALIGTMLLLVFVWFVLRISPTAWAGTEATFDGRPWNISTGNLSVSFIQASPIGAYPRPDFLEPPPSIDSQVHLRELGLVANEDYVAWGAVERAPGQWSWQQHDAVEHNLHAAGLKYVVYDWVHFPPVWLRDEQRDKRTLMRCLEHGQEAFYLSIFDPRTLEWYDHFYKNLSAHFGTRVDDVYACILGPYGEGNYPLKVPDWVNMGHCHEGYWCGDEFARRAFQSAMRQRYSSIGHLNRAWGSSLGSFSEVEPPRQLRNGQFKPSPAAFPTAQDKRRWLDFISWYHQAIIDFAEQSIRIVLKYYPAEKVRLKPGGSAGGVNPMPWGTYCPGYARMARPYHIVLQPADCQGAIFADKWVGTAYRYYGVKECTEPAGSLDEKAFARRLFSDADNGAAQLFTYEFERHAQAVREHVSLFTGKAGETAIAVYCPTTLYRLGDTLEPTIQACSYLRDLCDFDVLDELLITDGALDISRYRVLILFQGEIVEQAVLARLEAFRRAGGKLIMVGDFAIKSVEGRLWPGGSRLSHVTRQQKPKDWLTQLGLELAGITGVDAQLDGVWTFRRGNQVVLFNPQDKALSTQLGERHLVLAPHEIWAGPSLP